MSLRKICLCNEVTEAEIKNAIKRKGARTVDDIMKLTRAGKDCGKCKPKTQSILDRIIPQLDGGTTQLRLDFSD